MYGNSCIIIYGMRSEVFTAMKIQVVVLWVVTTTSVQDIKTQKT